MKKILFFLFIISILIACTTPRQNIKNFEGKLVYSVSSPLHNPAATDSINYQIVYAKDSMLRIDSYTPIGKQIFIKHIPKNKAYILMDIGVKKVAIQTVPDTLENNRYQFKNMLGKDKIAGRKAKKIKVTDTQHDTTIVMNYFSEIPEKYSTAIDGMPGLPAKYALFANGVWISYRLTKIEERTIDIDLFGIPSDHEIITLDEFIELIED